MKKLDETSLRLLNKIQRDIVIKQSKKHAHKSHTVDFDISGEKDYLRNFAVNEGVFCPFLSSARYHARFLFYNNHLFKGKQVIDIGSGTGLLGIVMAKCGAKGVLMSDISELAVANTLQNVKQYNLMDRVQICKSDLFENITNTADMIMWNIPFFPGYPAEGDTIAASMMMPPDLLPTFLENCKSYLNSGGVVVVPSYSLGGIHTDPKVVGERLGYIVQRSWTHNCANGIQQGLLYIDELRLD